MDIEILNYHFYIIHAFSEATVCGVITCFKRKNNNKTLNISDVLDKIKEMEDNWFEKNKNNDNTNQQLNIEREYFESPQKYLKFLKNFEDKTLFSSNYTKIIPKNNSKRLKNNKNILLYSNIDFTKWFFYLNGLSMVKCGNLFKKITKKRTKTLEFWKKIYFPCCNPLLPGIDMRLRKSTNLQNFENNSINYDNNDNCNGNSISKINNCKNMVNEIGSSYCGVKTYIGSIDNMKSTNYNHLNVDPNYKPNSSHCNQSADHVKNSV